MSRARCSCARGLLLGECVVQGEGDECDDALAVETRGMRTREPAVERSAQRLLDRTRQRGGRVIRDERSGARSAVDEALALQLARGLPAGARLDREIEAG